MILDPRASDTIGDVEETDGIAVESRALSSPLERCLFIAQDGVDGSTNQNFKLFAWRDIAGSRLRIDATRDPRKPV